MNEMPIRWAEELKDAYPAKSGPVGWGSMKLLLALRRALMQSTWGEIIDGCQRYKAYCEQSGKANTEFVQSPLRFIEDGCHLEEFTYQAPQTKEQQELAAIRARDDERMSRAREVGRSSGLTPYANESVGSFETRIQLAQVNGSRVGGIAMGVRGLPAEGGGPYSGQKREALDNSIASLANRLRVAK